MAATIKIPKVTDEWTEVAINRTGIIVTKNGGQKIQLKKQTIKGVVIPQGFEVWGNFNHLIIPELDTTRKEITASISRDKMNEILKTLFIRKLKEQ